METPADDLGFKLNPADITDETFDDTPEAAPTDHPSASEYGASDTVLGRLTGDAEDFGPGSGTLGDTNSPSDEAV